MVKVIKIFQTLTAGTAIIVIICLLSGKPISQGKLGFSRNNNSKENLPPFIIIVCHDRGKSLTSSFQRQLNQVTVLLKSAVTFTNETLRFLVVTNSDKIFERIKAIPRTWPNKHKSRLQFESRPVWYPPDRKDSMKGLLRPCSSARLFLPETLRDVDAAVLLDTDTIFLRPPEELLREIYRFDESQAAGLAQTSRGYRGLNIPYPKPRGVNTGVMVMNMTRLRALPGGWTGVTLKAFDENRKDLSKTVTNDIVNIALAQNHQIFYNLNCVWNYNTGCCRGKRNPCTDAEKTGVYLLHGTSGAFVDDTFLRFRAVYEAWQDYQLGSPLSTLLADMERRMKVNASPKTICDRLTNLEYIFTKSLKTMLQ
ncbi:glucoside xylosyltransferase 1-like [Macrobrachium rosenbergii]|uniref:glucoside xylosyltransferase 1-like n=1 Tax=Macrobrachium rosenbergii TaxID=79674 RepID=UPI0034D5C330